jgi:hypothetical protein
MSQVLGNDYVHDIDELDVYTELVEAPIQVVHQGSRQLTLDVTDLAHLDASDVVPDRLLALLSKELLQLVGAEIVQELLAILLTGGVIANMEGHTDVYRDLHVVFRRAPLNLKNVIDSLVKIRNRYVRTELRHHGGFYLLVC